MKLLLHTCCGPCLLYPLKKLGEMAENFNVTAYFYNPNIHPYKEFKKRLDCLEEVCDALRIPAVLERDYDLNSYLERVVFNEAKRCSLCYDLRLEQSVAFAKSNGYTYFSTTLLYSRYQNHSRIKDKCFQLAQQYELSFVYCDFRKGWQWGVDSSLAMDLYRQPYCGCIYSEQERYDNRLKKRLRKNKQS